MIICPLNGGECNTLIPPRPRAAFVMAPSTEYQTDTSKKVLRKIIKVLAELNYEVIEGSSMVRHGDYFCSICQTLQGCALGIAMVYRGLPVKTVSNIFLETGIMQGFGKPVILFVDNKRKTLASDYIRHYAISYNSSGYLSKYRSLLEDIAKLPEDMYEYLGEFALKAKDYEKAAKYYKEAYLINPKQETVITLESIASTLEKSKGIPRAYKQRLLENIQYFCSMVK
jgi:tetratricopeptide (TPR) repeat protein